MHRRETLVTHDIILGKLSERGDDSESDKEDEPSAHDDPPGFPPSIWRRIQSRSIPRLTDPRDMPREDLERFSIRDRLDLGWLIDRGDVILVDGFQVGMNGSGMVRGGV